MALDLINVGTVANDGTGDPLRTAFIKVNNNFALIYNIIPKDTGGTPVPVAPLHDPHFTGDPQTATAPPAGDADTSIPNTAWVDQYFAKKASPVFTGDPQSSGPILPATDNDKSLATTEWVKSLLTAPDLSGFAPITSPLFLGDPRRETALLVTDNDNSLATTKFVQDVVLGIDTGGNGTVIPPLIAKHTASIPQGRLTLQTLMPVMTSDQTAAAITYTPYVGSRVPLWDGTDMNSTQMPTTGSGEITVALNDTAKSPGQVLPDSIYDWYIWMDGSVPATPVMRLSHGLPWSTKVLRNEQLSLVRGIWVNTLDITNGPAGKDTATPLRTSGTYVGTSYTEAGPGNSIIWRIGGNMKKAQFHLWNAYNRVNIGCSILDTTNSWGYGTQAFRVVRGLALTAANLRAEAVSGTREDSFDLTYTSQLTPDGGPNAAYAIAGLGMDWTAGLPDVPAVVPWGSQILVAHHISTPVSGFHYWQAVEWASGACTFWGAHPNGAQYATGMTFNARM